MAIRKDKRRQASNEKYIDALQEKFSKVCVIRNDFGYKKDENNNVNITLDEANKHVNRFLSNRRNNSVFDNNIGYIFKIEEGVDKGIHIHALILFNGNNVQNDKFKGDQLGQYWKKITNGKGSYHNCNRNNYKDNATGMLDYRDIEKRRNLDKAMEYLAKDDQRVEALKENKKDRIIRRGTLPKEKGNGGRPRKD
jgi:hypothetical protein